MQIVAQCPLSFFFRSCNKSRSFLYPYYTLVHLSVLCILLNTTFLHPIKFSIFDQETVNSMIFLRKAIMEVFLYALIQLVLVKYGVSKF